MLGHVQRFPQVPVQMRAAPAADKQRPSKRKAVEPIADLVRRSIDVGPEHRQLEQVGGRSVRRVAASGQADVDVLASIDNVGHERTERVPLTEVGPDPSAGWCGPDFDESLAAGREQAVEKMSGSCSSGPPDRCGTPGGRAPGADPAEDRVVVFGVVRSPAARAGFDRHAPQEGTEGAGRVRVEMTGGIRSGSRLNTIRGTPFPLVTERGTAGRCSRSRRLQSDFSLSALPKNGRRSTGLLSRSASQARTAASASRSASSLAGSVAGSVLPAPFAKRSNGLAECARAVLWFRECVRQLRVWWVWFCVSP